MRWRFVNESVPERMPLPERRRALDRQWRILLKGRRIVSSKVQTSCIFDLVGWRAGRWRSSHCLRGAVRTRRASESGCQMVRACAQAPT